MCGPQTFLLGAAPGGRGGQVWAASSAEPGTAGVPWFGSFSDLWVQLGLRLDFALHLLEMCMGHGCALGCVTEEKSV